MDISIITAWSIIAIAYVFLIGPAIFGSPYGGYWIGVVNGLVLSLFMLINSGYFMGC